MNNNRITPFIATHPGEMIKDELKERNMTQKEKAMGIPAEVWMNLQTQFDIDSASIEERNKQKETVSITIPVGDLNLLREISRKFGWACMF